MFTSSGLCRASLGVALAAGLALAPGAPALAGEHDSRLLTQYADALGGANAGLTAPAPRAAAPGRGPPRRRHRRPPGAGPARARRAGAPAHVVLPHRSAVAARARH